MNVLKGNSLHGELAEDCTVPQKDGYTIVDMGLKVFAMMYGEKLGI